MECTCIIYLAQTHFSHRYAISNIFKVYKKRPLMFKGVYERLNNIFESFSWKNFIFCVFFNDYLIVE